MSIRRSNIDSEDLANRIKRREDAAFGEFAALFGPYFRWRLMEWGLEPYQAEDFAASFITDILLEVDQYQARDTGGFKAWVCSSFRNAFVDYYRQRRLDTVPMVEGRPDLDLATAFNPNWEDRAEAASSLEPEEIQAVHDAWRRLSGDERQILAMRNLRSAPPWSDIASELGIAEGTARVRHFRAHKRLAELLTGDPRVVRLAGVRTPGGQEN